MTGACIKKGMILGAGLGTRLLPVTTEIPKPLVPVLNVPNILYTLRLLQEAGIEEVIINLHHLPLPLETFLGTGGRWGMRISYSRESTLLGTGGGVKKAERFFEGQPFVLLNCDFITNVTLAPILERHQAQQALATMVLLEDPVLQPLYSKVGTDAAGRLCSLPKSETRAPARTGIFTGIHVLESEVLRYLQEIPCGINDVLYPTLMRNHADRVFGHFVRDIYWHDTGEIKTFWETSLKLLQGLQTGDRHLETILRSLGDYEAKRPGIWLSRGEKIPPGVELLPPVILGADCRLEEGAQIGPFAILGDRSTVGKGSRASRFVGLGEAVVDNNANLRGIFQFHRSILRRDPVS